MRVSLYLCVLVCYVACSFVCVFACVSVSVCVCVCVSEMDCLLVYVFECVPLSVTLVYLKVDGRSSLSGTKRELRLFAIRPNLRGMGATA